MLETEQEQSNKDAEAQNIPHNNLVFFKEAVEYIMKIAKNIIDPKKSFDKHWPSSSWKAFSHIHCFIFLEL